MLSISVAMATYNGQKFIREQLDSLAAQQHLPSELVITDDASSDKTVAIAEQFATHARFPVHIHRNNKRLGYRANFMRGASLCISDLIAFCDQDDIWSPRKLALCIEPFRDPAVLLAHHNAEAVTEAGKRLGNLDHWASAPMMPPLSLCPIGWETPFALGFTEVFHRSILKFSDLREMSLAHNGLRAPMAHDEWVFFIASVFGEIVYIDNALASYRQHGSNLFGWSPPLSRISGLRYLLGNPIDRLDALQQASKRCAEILEEASHNLTDTWQQRATLGAARYRLLTNLYAARKRLYKTANLAERVKAFHWISTASGYRPKRSWGLGRKALVRDLCLGIPVGPLLRYGQA